MFLFRSAKIKKRMEKLWSFCAYHISEYEKQCSQSVPSALPDLKKQVWNMMESFSDEISTWDDNSVDYDTISRTLLSHSAFDLLTSGKYHISPGMLNPMSCAAKIKTVYEKKHGTCRAVWHNHRGRNGRTIPFSAKTHQRNGLI